MNADLPDVLDALGCTPREFGTVHVHFEGFREVDGRRCVASVLAQASFVPSAAARVRLFDGETELASAPLPDLSDGRVVRVRIPFVSRGAVTSLSLLVEAAPPVPDAERVRPAWKLHDTVEVPRLSEMEPASEEPGEVGAVLVAASVAGLLLGIPTAGVSVSLPANTRQVVHKAMALPARLSGPLLPGVAKPVDGAVTEVVWAVGQGVPSLPPAMPVASRAIRAAPRWCRACGFEGAAEHERARTCPRCDEPWL